MSKNRVRHHVNPLSDRSEYSFQGFGNDKPIVVDIGADRGEFTEGLLEVHCETHNFLVLEIRRPLAERLEKKFAKNSNVKVFSGDAVRNLKSLLLPSIENDLALIETIYINFPDPWFKDRHHKRRVVCQRLLDDVKDWVQSETVWVYQTDQKQLFDDTHELLLANGQTSIEFFEESPHGLQTKWEQAKINAGQLIHRMKFTVQ